MLATYVIPEQPKIPNHTELSYFPIQFSFFPSVTAPPPFTILAILMSTGQLFQMSLFCPSSKW